MLYGPRHMPKSQSIHKKVVNFFEIFVTAGGGASVCLPAHEVSASRPWLIHAQPGNCQLIVSLRLDITPRGCERPFEIVKVCTNNSPMKCFGEGSLSPWKESHHVIRKLEHYDWFVDMYSVLSGNIENLFYNAVAIHQTKVSGGCFLVIRYSCEKNK